MDNKNFTRYESKTYNTKGDLVCKDVGYTSYWICRDNSMEVAHRHNAEFIIIELVEFKSTKTKSKELRRQIISLHRLDANEESQLKQTWLSTSF